MQKIMQNGYRNVISRISSTQVEPTLPTARPAVTTARDPFGKFSRSCTVLSAVSISPWCVSVGLQDIGITPQKRAILLSAEGFTEAPYSGC